MPQATTDLVKAHWENPNTVSLSDTNLKELEIASIESAIPKGVARLADVGCGDGEGLIRYARRALRAVGVDYSETMIRKAQARILSSGLNNVEVQCGDARELPFPKHSIDVVVSERCVINLLEWEEQKQAMDEAHRVLKSDGRYLLNETTWEGLDRLNGLRRACGLEAIAQPWHNRNLLEHELHAYFKERGWAIIARKSQGFFQILSRVVQPLLVSPNSPSVDHPLNAAARRFVECTDFDVGHIGAVTLYVLCKASSRQRSRGHRHRDRNGNVSGAGRQPSAL